MGTYDVLMLLVLLVTAYLGWQKGMAWQIASLASIVISYIVAMQFRDAVSQHLNIAPPLDTFVAMLVLYAGTSIVIWLLFRVVRRSIENWKLRDFDRQMGAIVGAGKGAVLCCIITLFAVTLLGEQQRQTIISSRSGFYIAVAMQRAGSILPVEVQELLGPYLERLQQPTENPYADPSLPMYEPQIGHQPEYPQYARPETPEYVPPNSQPWPEENEPDRRARTDIDNWR